MKLELKHLAPYLPYGLKLFDTKNNCVVVMTKFNFHLVNDFDKPILRPLSDLTREDELYICEYSNIERVVYSGNPSNLYFVNTEEKTYLDDYLDSLNYLFENHFDVFGLIEKDLAIDINTLEK